MPERRTVMISSTAVDLPDYREKAMRACTRLGLHPVWIEDLTAAAADAVEKSMAMVDKCDIYLGILAHRYGTIAEGHDVSITELEYNRARGRDYPSADVRDR